VFRLTRLSDYWISNKKFDFLLKLPIHNFYRYILYINKDRKPRTFDYTPGWGQAVTGFPTKAGPLAHYITLNNNLLVLQGSKIVRLNLNFLEVQIFLCGTVS
jgi:hypothetical protein